MPFVLPTFNLTINIWHPPVNVLNPPAVTCPGNLAWSKRTKLILPTNPGPGVWPLHVMHLLLPALTDVRDRFSNGGPSDVVEVPAGTGRFYFVVGVDDIGKGFPNEHRCALIYQGNAWPVPIP